MAIKRYNQEFGLKGQPLPDDPRFCEWRRRQVTDFLRWVNAYMLEIKPNLVISAAVFANLQDAYGYRFSDWLAWNKEGIIDLCLSMDFSPDNNRIFNPRAEEAFKNQGNRYVCVGQAAYMNTKENTLAQLGYIRNKGFVGEVFYDYRHPNAGQADQSGVFAFIKAQFQPAWTNTPALPWKRAKGIIKGTVRRKGGEAIYNAVVSISTDPVRTQTTEPHGKFAFFDLAPGSYNITVRRDGLAETIAKGQAETGTIVTVDVQLSP